MTEREEVTLEIEAYTYEAKAAEIRYRINDSHMNMAKLNQARKRVKDAQAYLDNLEASMDYEQPPHAELAEVIEQLAEIQADTYYSDIMEATSTRPQLLSALATIQNVKDEIEDKS